MDDEPAELPTSFSLLAAATIMGAIADAVGHPVGLVRHRGLAWALANPRQPRTAPQRQARANALAWLRGAPATLPASEACAAVGVRPERLLAVLLGEPAAARRAA